MALAVHLPEDDIDAADDCHHVGDHISLADFGADGEIDERRSSRLHTIGGGGAVAHNIEPDLSAGRLGTDVHVPRVGTDAPRDRGLDVSLRDLLKRLLDNLKTLLHLPYPDDVAVPAIADRPHFSLPDFGFPVEPGINRIGIVTPQIPVDARPPPHPHTQTGG